MASFELKIINMLIFLCPQPKGIGCSSSIYISLDSFMSIGTFKLGVLTVLALA